MFPYNHDLKISEATYADNEYSGIQRLHELRMSGPDKMKDYLNSAAVYAYGTNFSKNFPILTEIQGKGKKRAVTSVDGTVYSHLFGKPKKTSVIAKCIYNPSDKIGKGNATIYLFFKDRHFMKNQKIISGGFNGVQLHLQSDGIKEGSFYKYEAKTISRNGAPIPYRYVKQGTIWGGGPVIVSAEHSRGTEHRSYSGYKIQNSISMSRQSFKVAGNISNKVMNLAIKVDGGKTFNTFVDWERYLTELSFHEVKELDLIISKSNKDSDGYVQNVDANSGKPAPMFMGIWEQIPSFNTMNYTRLTENKLSRWLTDILSISGNLDLIGSSGNNYVDVMGGYGLLQEFDAAMKRKSEMLTPMPDSNTFIKDGGNGLQFGAYFTSYKHISGTIFRFTHHPFFDGGSAIADSSDFHPLNPSLKITSYFGMILNFGMVTVSKDASKNGDGVASNIEYLYEGGREYDEWVVEGGAQLPGTKKSYSRSTDIDASSLEMVCTQGVHCHYPMSMGKIVCSIS